MSPTPPSPPSEHASRYHPEPDLTREYVEIKHSLGSRTVEQNPDPPPTADALYARNRSYQIQLIQRNEYWYNDPARSLSHIHRNRRDTRDGTQRAAEEEAARGVWKDSIDADVRLLWGAVGRHTEDPKPVSGRDRKMEPKYRFFALCKERLMEIEEMGMGVSMAEFQGVVLEVLLEFGLKLRPEGFVVLKEMATERREKKGKE